MFQKKTVSELVSKEVIQNRYGKAGIEELIRKDAEANGCKVTKIDWNGTVNGYDTTDHYGKIKTLTVKVEAKELSKPKGTPVTNPVGNESYEQEFTSKTNKPKSKSKKKK